ncbi:hypothetical protein KDL29_06020 [bacterium]|nr:hypothetical protein [bacterium]
MKLFWIAMAMLALLAGCNQPAADSLADMELKAHIATIEQNLLDWARQNGGLYPETLNADLMKDGQNMALINPYDRTEMHPVAFTAGELAAGNVCYIAVHDGYEVKDYILLGFGEDMAAGQDMDGDGKPDGVIEVRRSSGVSAEKMRSMIEEMK